MEAYYSSSLLPYSSFLIFDNISQNTYESIMNQIYPDSCLLAPGSLMGINPS